MAEEKTKKIGRLIVLRNYFGLKEGEDLRSFASECAKLTEEDKVELSQGAARELGLSQDQIDFPLE